MNNNLRYMRKGRIVEIEENLSNLEVQIESATKDIIQDLFMFDGVESIKIASAKLRMQELDEYIGKYKKDKSELKKLKESE